MSHIPYSGQQQEQAVIEAVGIDICTQIIDDLAQECCWSIGHYHCVYGEETDANQVPTEPSNKENNL